MIDFQKLSLCPVFRGVSRETTESLIQSIHYQVRKFKKDEVVAHAGQAVQDLMIMLNGSVRGEMIDYSGKVVKIEDIEAPKPLAAAFLFGNENKFPVTVSANEEVMILVVPVEEFLKVLQNDAQVLKNYLHNISTRAQFLSRKIHFLSFKTIKEKVAHFLLETAGEKLHSFELKQTQQQLADLFGVTRPALARVFGEMQKEELIKMERKTVTLKDKHGLNELLKNG